MTTILERFTVSQILHAGCLTVFGYVIVKQSNIENRQRTEPEP